MTKSADVASLLASSRPYLCERDDIVDTADGAARSVNGRAQGHSIKHECWPVPRESSDGRNGSDQEDRSFTYVQCAFPVFVAVSQIARLKGERSGFQVHETVITVGNGPGVHSAISARCTVTHASVVPATLNMLPAESCASSFQ
jgi:hypothetical protein